MNVFEENNFHFYEVSSALARYCIREEGQELEADELCFRYLNKRSQKKFPTLKETGIYNSRHAINVIRVQNMFRNVLERIRERRKSTEVKPKPD
jgi:hypothetical protein